MQVDMKNMFDRCRGNCVCEGVCKAAGLKECLSCKTVLRSQCTKQTSRTADGKRPKMEGPCKNGAKQPIHTTGLHEDESGAENDNTDIPGPSSRRSTSVCAKRVLWYDLDDEDFSEGDEVDDEWCLYIFTNIYRCCYCFFTLFYLQSNICLFYNG